MATTRNTQALLDELKTWCAVRGRKTIAARYLASATGLSFETAQQTVSHWFADPPRQQPTADQILAVQEFMKRRRRARPSL
jgi:hypothetical protein